LSEMFDVVNGKRVPYGLRKMVEDNDAITLRNITKYVTSGQKPTSTVDAHTPLLKEESIKVERPGDLFKSQSASTPNKGNWFDELRRIVAESPDRASLDRNVRNLMESANLVSEPHPTSKPIRATAIERAGPSATSAQKSKRVHIRCGDIFTLYGVTGE
jgi:hypothetical protein